MLQELRLQSRSTSVAALLCCVLLCLAVRDGRGESLGELTRAPRPRGAAPVDAGNRQGGDTIADAHVIGQLPFTDAGTTTGYADDYEWACPFSAWAPDVVYSIIPDADACLTVDLYGSDYDTKVFIYNEAMDVVACNDDYYEDYTSRISEVMVSRDATYHIVVDGYGDHHGEYCLLVKEYSPCEVMCPTDAYLENEPPLDPGYVDAYNGGCVSDSGVDPVPVQPLVAAEFCGVSGWYWTGGSWKRDTDWFVVIIPENGVLEIELTPEMPTNMWYVTHDDCDNLTIVQHEYAVECASVVLSVAGDPGDQVDIVLEPFGDGPPDAYGDHEYDYLMTTNLDVVIRTERRSWSSIKGCFE